MSWVLRATTPAALATGALLLGVPVADGATRVVVKGAGFGHGVGMSQYGTYGFALRGTRYPEILAHYYTGTRLATLTNDAGTTVLLRSSKTAAFTGASRIAGRGLDPAKVYSVIEQAGTVVLRSSAGRRLASFGGPVRIAGRGGAPVKLLGPGPNAVRDGRFRGELEFRPSGGSLLVINALGLEDYVRGVVAGESPSSWPAEALRAQAVAARTYALATSKAGNGFEQYPDTRSQVYNGVAGETATTDAAVAATNRQVVTFLGKPIVAYFFSTSGGRTENVENGFPGAAPAPYLKSVADPYDDASPKHRWRFSFTLAQAQQRLRGAVKGKFRSVRVTKRGVSPRIVTARVIGSRGTTVISGPELRRRFGLFDTWATFTTIGAKVTAPPREEAPATPAAQPPAGGPSTGGASPGSGRSLRAAALSAAPATPSPTRYRKVLSGHVAGATEGHWLRVQRRTASGTWRTAFWTTVRGDSGRYRATLPGKGTYRVTWRGLAGPGVVAR